MGWFSEILGSKEVYNAIVLSGLIVAIAKLFHNGMIAKKIQTANFLFESRKDKEYREGISKVKELHVSGMNLRNYVIECDSQAITPEMLEDRAKIQYIMNFYEKMAVSIKNGIYCEKMLKDSSYNTLVKTYDCSKTFIDAVREKENRSTIYQEFERLANRWKKNPLKSYH